MNNECKEIKSLFDKLWKQCARLFPPKPYETLDAPKRQGVYIIRKGQTVLHVGITEGGKGGLHQRLRNHLNNKSSFAKNHLEGNGEILRKNIYQYQYFEVEASRKRALLEAYATGMLCPEYLGLREKKVTDE